MFRKYTCTAIITATVVWAGLTSLAAAQASPTLTPKALCVSQTPNGYWGTFRYLSTGLTSEVLIPGAWMIMYPSPPLPPKDFGENVVLVGDTALRPSQRGESWPLSFADTQVSGLSAFTGRFVTFSVWFPAGSSATWKLRLPNSPYDRTATADATSPKCAQYNEPWGDAGTPAWPIHVGYARIAVQPWPNGCVNIHHYILKLPQSYRAGTKVVVVSRNSPATATPPFLLTGHRDFASHRDIPYTFVRNHQVRLNSTPCGRFTVVVHSKGRKNLLRTWTRIPPPWDPYTS
jgi:hypothetical protein